MSKPLVVIVDTNKELLYPLLGKLLDELPEAIRLEVISESEYRDEYFRDYRMIDLLVISEKDYLFNAKLHKIATTIVLMENQQDVTEKTGDNILRLYRYSKSSIIMNAILSFIPNQYATEDRTGGNTKVILVTSESGGEGKTLLALSLMKGLNAINKKALYVDAEWTQKFDLYLEQEGNLTVGEMVELLQTMGKDYEKTRQYMVQQKDVHFLKGCSTSLASFSKTTEVYVNLLKNIVEAKEYQYVIVDTNSCLDDVKLFLVGISDKVVIISRQDDYAGKRLERMLSNFNISLDKCLFVGNMAEQEKERVWLSSGECLRFLAYLPLLDEKEGKLLDAFMNQAACRALTYMVM